MFPKFTMLRRKKSVSYIDESLAALAAAANSGGTGEVGHDCESLGSQRLRQMQHDSTIENLDIQALAEVVEKTFPGLGYAEIFRKNEISGSQMLELEKDDLRAIGISKLGHILTLLDLRFQNFSNKLSIRKEYEGIVQKDSRYLRIAGWKLICKVEKEEKEGGEGEVRKKFFLVWPKEPSKLKECRLSGRQPHQEYYYKSRPLLLYDLHRDFASDGKNNYFIEGAYRDESQKNSDILRLTRLMQEEGTRKNNKRTRGNSLSVAFPPKLVVKVIPKSKVFLHLDIEVTEINLQMEKFSIACELNIFWKDPDIFAEKRAIPIMDDDKDTDVRCFPRCPIALTRKGEDRLPLSFNRLFANGLGRSLVITHREEDFYSQVGVVHGRYKLSISLEEEMELGRFPFDRQLLHIPLLVDTGDWVFCEKPPDKWKLPSHLNQSQCHIKLAARARAESVRHHISCSTVNDDRDDDAHNDDDDDDDEDEEGGEEEAHTPLPMHLYKYMISC